MPFRGAAADEECLGDLAIALAGHHEAQYLQLTRGQPKAVRRSRGFRRGAGRTGEDGGSLGQCFGQTERIASRILAVELRRSECGSQCRLRPCKLVSLWERKLVADDLL